ncbi:MAG: RtcB family protein [Candidatus Paceibacterota bacterium]|jgi:tRNA-splicing ligase RtcB
MKKVIVTERIPIKMWLGDIEQGALNQGLNLANLPFAFKHIAIMPDAHQGYGMPIGGVLATRRAVIPNAVGVDIGCGMCAVRTDLTDISQETLKKIMERIREAVPVGFKHHAEPQENDFYLPGQFGPIIAQEEGNIDYQIGTLGGGNHFIEIQKGSDGNFWIMIHSGSRNLGKKVADFYNKIAVKLNEQWHSSVPKQWELAFLPMDTPEYKGYLQDMQICVDFALANRKLMMDRITAIFYTETLCDFESMINIAHNYAKMENHFGENVLVHRKGATSAKVGQIGIIPGSQGTKSYVVEGMGNPESFQSCSHGAGRCMGRKDATRRLDLKTEIKRLDDQGIIHGIRNIDDLDEAAGAYKDIAVVMENQKDLVKILVELKPVAVIKG